MVFWSINFFARGIRLGSLLLDQTGRPPVKQRANELWTPEVGTPLGSVAECLSNRGATHKRTGSAGMSHGETLSKSHHPSQGGRLIGGPTNLRLLSLLAGNGNPAAPVLHNTKMRVCPSEMSRTPPDAWSGSRVGRCLFTGTTTLPVSSPFGVHYG